MIPYQFKILNKCIKNVKLKNVLKSLILVYYLYQKCQKLPKKFQNLIH